MRIAHIVVGLVIASPVFAQPADQAPPAPSSEEPKPPSVEPAPAPAAPVPATAASVAAPAVTPATDVAVEEPAAFAASGFALEVKLESGQTLIDNNFALPTMQAGIFLGHHSDPLTIGVGFELGSITDSHSESNGMGGSTNTSQTITTVLVMPGIRFRLVRSSDRRTELLGQLDAGVGATFMSTTPSMGSDPPSTHRLRLQGGPAIRHWIGRSFAVGGTAGIRYDRQSRTTDNGSGSFTSEMTLSNTGIFGSLQITAVF